MSSPINMQKLNQEGKKIFVIKNGTIGMQLSEEKAEFVCYMLANWLGLSVTKKQEVSLRKEKANEKSTIEKPLGA